MNREQVRAVVIEELCRLAPELDRAALSDEVRIREELDLDSFDFVRLLTALDQRTGVAIPEVDSARLETIGGCVDYLREKLQARA